MKPLVQNDPWLFRVETAQSRLWGHHWTARGFISHMVLNTSFMDRKLGPDSFLCWSDVERCEKLSRPQNFSQCGRKILALLLWCSAWGLSERFSAWVELWQDLGCSNLSSSQKKKKINSSLIYQTIDLSGICSIFYKALLDKDVILWTCSFLALKWFCDILAAHIGSKSIFTHCGNFLFRESSDDFWICFLVTSSTPTPWSYWDF